MSRVILGLKQAKIPGLWWIVMGLQNKKDIAISVDLVSDIRHINRVHGVVSNPNTTISLKTYPVNLTFWSLYCTWTSSSTECRTHVPLSLQSSHSTIHQSTHLSAHLSICLFTSTTAPSWNHPHLQTPQKSQEWWGRWQRFLSSRDHRHPTGLFYCGLAQWEAQKMIPRCQLLRSRPTLCMHCWRIQYHHLGVWIWRSEWGLIRRKSGQTVASIPRTVPVHNQAEEM